jgi:mannose-6-phosphate isomerase-like protein (cupin superfamily)
MAIRCDRKKERTMLIKDLKKCKEIIAGDDTILRELLNPLKDDIEIRYSLAHAVVKPGKITRPHRLKSSEIYYVLEGVGEMHVDDGQERVSPGQVVYIPPDSVQRIRNVGTGDLVFLCIVDPVWRPEDEEILG